MDDLQLQFREFEREREAIIVQETFLRGYDLTKWKISPTQLQVKEKIGQGAFGIVRRGLIFEHGTKKTVAVKTPINTTGMKGETEIEKFWEEFEILKGLGQHVHIVGLIGVLMKPYEPPSLVVEYCQGGDLQSHLKHVSRTSRQISVSLMQCIAHVLSFPAALSIPSAQ